MLISGYCDTITIDWVIKRRMENKTTRIKWLNNTTLENLDFADDIALLSHSYNDHQIKTTPLSEIASQVGLLINSTKTKIVETLTSPNTITLNGNDIEKVNNCTYLGSYLSNILWTYHQPGKNTGHGARHSGDTVALHSQLQTRGRS